MVDQLPGFAERIFYHPIISMPELDTGGVWDGPVGFVHELVETTLRPAFSSYEYYLAGPPPMVEACVKLVALQEKVPFSQIHYDRFF